MRPLNQRSPQGDRVICEILGNAGMTIRFDGQKLVAAGGVRRPIFANLEACPDAFPLLAAVSGCCLPGSRLEGLANLVHKERDRLGVIERMRADDASVMGTLLRLREHSGPQDGGGPHERPGPGGGGQGAAHDRRGGDGLGGEREKTSSYR